MAGKAPHVSYNARPLLETAFNLLGDSQSKAAAMTLTLQNKFVMVYSAARFLAGAAYGLSKAEFNEYEWPEALAKSFPSVSDEVFLKARDHWNWFYTDKEFSRLDEVFVGKLHEKTETFLGEVEQAWRASVSQNRPIVSEN